MREALLDDVAKESLNEKTETCMMKNHLCNSLFNGPAAVESLERTIGTDRKSVWLEDEQEWRIQIDWLF